MPRCVPRHLWEGAGSILSPLTTRHLWTAVRASGIFWLNPALHGGSGGPQTTAVALSALPCCSTGAREAGQIGTPLQAPCFPLPLWEMLVEKDESGAMQFVSTGRVTRRQVWWWSGRAPEDVQQGAGSSTTGASCGLGHPEAVTKGRDAGVRQAVTPLKGLHSPGTTQWRL